MKDKILIVNAMSYSIIDEVTKVINEGVSFHYCMTGDFKSKAEEKGFHGYRVLKGSVPIDNEKELRAVPGFFDCEFDIVTDSKSGKAVLKPLSFKYAKGLE